MSRKESHKEIWICDLCEEEVEREGVETNSPKNWCKITTSSNHPHSITGSKRELDLCSSCGVLIESILHLRGEEHTRDERWEDAQHARDMLQKMSEDF